MSWFFFLTSLLACLHVGKHQLDGSTRSRSSADWLVVQTAMITASTPLPALLVLKVTDSKAVLLPELGVHLDLIYRGTRGWADSKL